jgi:hypothetical protein
MNSIIYADDIETMVKICAELDVWRLGFKAEYVHGRGWEIRLLR